MSISEREYLRCIPKIRENILKCETRWYAGVTDDVIDLKLSKFIDMKTGKDVTNRYADRFGLHCDKGFMVRYANDMQETFSQITLRG